MRQESKRDRLIDPCAFYGSKKLCLKPSINRMEFPKQKDAFKFVDELSPQDRIDCGQGWTCPIVFGEEMPPNGHRVFVVLGKKDVIVYLLDLLRPLQRHLYEIIREDSPVRLYLDLEFKSEFNIDLDGNSLVQKVIEIFLNSLKEEFDMVLDISQVVDLDSSTPTKFSRHLIFHIPKLFKNNRECGAFVSYVHNQYRNQLMIQKDEETQTSFIDLCVYSRNRMFRTFLSSKFAKNAVLEPSIHNRFPYNDSNRESIESFFESCLIVPNGALDYPMLTINTDRIQIPSLPRTVSCTHGNQKFQSCTEETDTQFPIEEAVVIDHIRSACNYVGPVPKIRSRCLIHDDDPAAKSQDLLPRLLLNIQNNRFCHKIQRQHRSNNQYYIVDRNTRTFYQKCYDPDCSQYYSQKWTYL